MHKVSIVIPTYNGAQRLPSTLSALSKQSCKEFEVIIVNDGSTDATIEVVNSFEEKLPTMKLINQKNGGRSVARNSGAVAAKYPIILFIDDDIEIDSSNVEKHLSFHLKNKDSVLVGNPMLNSQKIGHDAFLNYRGRIESLWHQSDRETKTVTFDNYFFTTQNLSIPQKLFQQIGMFDERLSDSEDFDLSMRLLKDGKAIFFNPSLVCWHNDFANLSQTIKRQIEYYRTKIKVLQLHPDYIFLAPKQFEWMKTNNKDNVKNLVFQFRFFWEKFFASCFFLFFPENTRYFFYSAFIYTHSVIAVKKEL